MTDFLTVSYTLTCEILTLLYYMKPEKGAPFRRNLSVWAIRGSTAPPPPPPGTGSSYRENAFYDSHSLRNNFLVPLANFS